MSFFMVARKFELSDKLAPTYHDSSEMQDCQQSHPIAGLKAYQSATL